MPCVRALTPRPKTRPLDSILAARSGVRRLHWTSIDRHPKVLAGFDPVELPRPGRQPGRACPGFAVGWPGGRRPRRPRPDPCRFGEPLPTFTRGRWPVSTHFHDRSLASTAASA
jgi:hypothetical protein